MNNPAFNGRHRYFAVIRLAFVTTLLVSQSLGCVFTSQSSPNSDSDAVIGKPPPADSDPFAVISLPADATPVAHQGIIDSNNKPDVLSDKEEDIAIKAEVQPVIPPEIGQEKHSEPSQDSCFSCVRICTTENTSPDCSDAPQDLICGWGTDPDLEQAKAVARAHCKSTLDMARSMPMYSRIEGDCPPASCR